MTIETLTITQPHALLTLRAAELRDIFNAVLAHKAVLDPDDENADEQYAQVHLEVRGDRLRLACSDKYTMGICQRPLSSVHEGFSCSYALAGVAVRAAVLELNGPLAHLLIQKDSVSFTGTGWTNVIPATKSHLPWRSALARLSPTGVPMDDLLVRPEHLARFRAAQPLHPDSPILFQLRGEGQALIGTLGDDFLGLVMPVRKAKYQASGQVPESPLDPWFDLVDED